MKVRCTVCSPNCVGVVDLFEKPRDLKTCEIVPPYSFIPPYKKLLEIPGILRFWQILRKSMNSIPR